MRQLLLPSQSRNCEVETGVEYELTQLIRLSLLHALNGYWSQAISALDRAEVQSEHPKANRETLEIASTRALLAAYIGDTLRARSSLVLCSDLLATVFNHHQCSSMKAQLAQRMLCVDQGEVGAVSEMVDRDAACYDSQYLPFAMHVIAQRLLLHGEVDDAMHLLEDLTISRSLDVRTDTVLGGLLMRDYCDALMLAGEGNRLLQCAQRYPKKAVAQIPLAHFWLRLEEPEKSLRYTLFVLNGTQVTRRDRYEARLLQAAAEIQLGNEISARKHFQACEGAVNADFPSLYRKFPAEVNRNFETLRAYRRSDDQCSLRLAALLNEEHRHPSACVLAKTDEPFRFVHITEREREILSQLSEGATAQDIAQRNVVSVHTVRTQLKAVYRKLSVNSASSAVMQAERLGFLFETMFE